jgi:hypothetical protein
MLITGILAAGSEFRHRTIIPALLATPRRSCIFAAKVAVVAAVGAAVGAVVFGLGFVAIVLELSAHGIHHLPTSVASLYEGTVISSACFGMIGVALGTLTRNTVGAIIAPVAWTLFIEQVILRAAAPGIESSCRLTPPSASPTPRPRQPLLGGRGRDRHRLRHRRARAGQPHHHPARHRLTQRAGHPLPHAPGAGAAVSAGTHPGRYQFPPTGSGRMADLKEGQFR